VHDVAFVEDQVSVELWPTAIFGWLNVMVIEGAGVEPPPPPQAPRIVRENKVAAIRVKPVLK
jgi:hypothetical protein